MHALSRSLPGFCKLLRSKRKIRASFVVNHLVLQPPRTATLPGVERHSLDINCGRGILTTVRRCRRGTSIRLPPTDYRAWWRPSHCRVHETGRLSLHQIHKRNSEIGTG
uniref:Expressed protein n=1 Tax=Echinococcus granulosus TaxID=6210 RepID=A0A068WXW6_ECHGR|nr:expressed protein [Echinococcus granulosus]